jgi:hypothetical protein
VSRRFDRNPGIADMIVIVIAVALSLAVSRHADPLAYPPSPDWIFVLVIRASVDSVVGVALALIVIRSVREGNSRRALRTPGVFACAIIVLIRLCFEISSRIVDHYNRLSDIYEFAPLGSLFFGGICVAAGWAMLGLTDNFRAEPDWLDRAGRAIGALWVLLTAAIVFAVFVQAVIAEVF